MMVLPLEGNRHNFSNIMNIDKHFAYFYDHETYTRKIITQSRKKSHLENYIIIQLCNIRH